MFSSLSTHIRIYIVGSIFSLFFFSINLVAAQGEPVQLGIRQVGGSGNYIDLTLEPGATQELTIELGNYGTSPVVAYTFLADVYSLVNGGMGVELEASTGEGVSGWVDYPAQTLTIEPRSAIQTSFVLRVPADAQPGEYLTSIVLQSEASAPSATSGVAIQQVLRQAMAIAVTVPGPRTPALSIGGVTSHEVAGHTYLRIELFNSGNVRLEPQGDFILRDSLGNEVSRYAVTMGSIYAGTSTLLEVPFAGVLNPGDYQITLDLHDPTAGDLAQVEALPLDITPPVVPTDVPMTAVANQAPINQVPVNQVPVNQVPVNPTATTTSSSPLGISPDILFIGGVIVLIVIALLPMLRRRRV